MIYRKEIDGLRALAVLPVILFHAGFRVLSGGFFGVDIFFVISGYLITSIIRSDLKADRFSIAKFYLRRARRILPALYLVMAFSLLLGYYWMMPDEFKNFGQSIFATTLFSNNILLARTSGYWDLASEFKPLLHTWSLGVEEQYYIIFPIVLILTRNLARQKLLIILGVAMMVSALAAFWTVQRYPEMAFYMLPTRAWELLAGALAAIHLSAEAPAEVQSGSRAQVLSFGGLLMIAGSVVFFDQSHPPPGYLTMVPVLGAVLIILYANKGTFSHRLLSGRVMVGIGLMSYSLYLWHQPLLAFSRIFSVTPPSREITLGLIAIAFVLSYLSWKFVETPFRTGKFIGVKSVIYFTAVSSLILLLVGFYLNRSYGIPGRVFDPSVRIADMDKRIYNERAFQFKTEGFTSTAKTHLLIVGDSFGRDLVNMTLESFQGTQNAEIVYRDDLTQGIFPYKNSVAEKLFGSADVIVFAGTAYNLDIVSQDIRFAKDQGKRLFYLGIKHFGYNLNWISRLGEKERANQYNPLLQKTLDMETLMSAHIPPENYLSLLAFTAVDGKIPITDSSGHMLSTDRAHLTKYGAEFFGQKALVKSRYAEIFAKPAGRGN